MKKYLLLCFLVLASLTNFAQLSGINTKAANTNTYLHLDESGAATKVYKGVLTSRYSTSDRNSKFVGLTAAENGLLIYNTTENCYNYWKHNGTTGTWVSLCGCLPGAPGDFLYYANCGAAVSSPSVLNLGTNTTGGTITVPIVVTNSGTIKAYLATINGVTFSNPAIPVTSSTTSYTINFSGTPATLAPIVVPINDNNDNIICNVTIPVIYGPASIACTTPTTSAATVLGTITVGTPLNASNTMALTVNVTTPGNYAAFSYTSPTSGINFNTPAGTFANTGPQTIYFTASGTPQPAAVGPNHVLSTTSPLGLCDVTVNVNPAFSYAYTCGPWNSATLPNFRQYVFTSGSFTIPVSATGTGTIPATSVLNNGITYNIAATNATSSTTFLTVTYSGTPVNAGSTVFSVGACSYPFPVAVGVASFTCAASPLANVQGTYQVGYGLTAANKFDVNFNVSAIGTYATMSYSGGGMTFTAPAGTFASIGNNVVTFTASPINASNKPTTFGANALTYSGPATGCSVSIPVTYGAAQFTCIPIPVTAITGTYNVDYPLTASNKFDVIYNVTVPGTYSGLALSGGGMSFTTPDGTFTAIGNNQSLTYTASPIQASNTPTVFGNNTLTGTGSPSGCTIAIPVTYGNAEFTCSTASAPNSSGLLSKYIVGQALNSTDNYINLSLTVTKRGNINIESENKNGMFFSFTNGGAAYTLTGAQTVTLSPSAASTPNDSEQPLGSAIGNNSYDTFAIFNRLAPAGSQTLGCSVNIDVKPQVYTGARILLNQTLIAFTTNYQWAAANGSTNLNATNQYATGSANYSNSMATDGIISLDLRPQQNGALNFWSVYIKNLNTTSAIAFNGLYNDSSVDANKLTDLSGSIGPGARLGSLDPYGQGTGAIPLADGGLGGPGAFGTGSSYREQEDGIINIQSGGKWYQYRTIFDGTEIAPPILLGATNNSYLKTYIVLISITTTAKASHIYTVDAGNYVTDLTPKDPKSYWP